MIKLAIFCIYYLTKMKNKEETIEELKRLIKDYETIIEIHTEYEVLNQRKEYMDYIDSILDEINDLRRKIDEFEKE